MAVYSSSSSSLSTVVLGLVPDNLFSQLAARGVPPFTITKGGTITTQLLVHGPLLRLLAKVLSLCFGGAFCTFVNLADFGLTVAGCFEEVLRLFDRVLLRLRLDKRESCDQLL